MDRYKNLLLGMALILYASISIYIGKVIDLLPYPRSSAYSSTESWLVSSQDDFAIYWFSIGLLFLLALSSIKACFKKDKGINAPLNLETTEEYNKFVQAENSIRLVAGFSPLVGLALYFLSLYLLAEILDLNFENRQQSMMEWWELYFLSAFFIFPVSFWYIATKLWCNRLIKCGSISKENLKHVSILKIRKKINK